jgi:Lamin Tail Domain
MTKRTLLATGVALAIVAFGVSANAGVIINEIDYDQPSTDTAEWLELHNPDALAQSLAGLDLVFINGSNCTAYGTFALDTIGVIPPGGYVVIGNHPCADTSVDIGASNAIQNGAPDGMRIVDRNTGGVLDSVEYEQPGASVCGDTATPATDNSADDNGSIQFCGNGWIYADISTPCALNNCGPVSVESSSWGSVKADYR